MEENLTQEELYDKIINEIVWDLYRKYKDAPQISIRPNFKNNSHKCFMRFCKIMQDVFGIEIKVSMPFWRYIIFRIKFRYKWKRTTITNLSVDDYISEVEKIYGKGILDGIFRAYYSRN